MTESLPAQRYGPPRATDILGWKHSLRLVPHPIPCPNTGSRGKSAETRGSPCLDKPMVGQGWGGEQLSQSVHHSYCAPHRRTNVCVCCQEKLGNVHPSWAAQMRIRPEKPGHIFHGLLLQLEPNGMVQKPECVCVCLTRPSVPRRWWVRDAFWPSTGPSALWVARIQSSNSKKENKLHTRTPQLPKG